MFDRKQSLTLASLSALLLGFSCRAGFAQSDPSAAEINAWLDNASSFGQGSAAPGANSYQNITGQPAGNWPAPPNNNAYNQAPWRQYPHPRIQGRPVNQSYGQNPFARLSPKDVFRIMFGGNPGDNSAAARERNANAYAGASGNLQTALDQAAQAEDAASRASYGSDQGARQSAAAEAQDHANAARAAADAAYETAYGASSEAQDQAAQARDAANRAQYAADRGAANANGGGW